MDPINPANSQHEIPQVQIGFSPAPPGVHSENPPVGIPQVPVPALHLVDPPPTTNLSQSTPPMPTDKEPHPHTHWKLIAFIFMIAFFGLLAFTLYLWNQNSMLIKESPSVLLPSPTSEPNPEIITSACPEGFTLLETEVYSLCYPLDMTPTTTSNPSLQDPNVTSYISTIDNQLYKINVISSFQGGWGGGACETAETSVNGIKTTTLTWDGDGEAPCGEDITNKVSLIGNSQSDDPRLPIVIDFQGKSSDFVNPTTFDMVLQSLKLK